MTYNNYYGDRYTGIFAYMLLYCLTRECPSVDKIHSGDTQFVLKEGLESFSFQNTNVSNVQSHQD